MSNKSINRIQRIDLVTIHSSIIIIIDYEIIIITNTIRSDHYRFARRIQWTTKTAQKLSALSASTAMKAFQWLSMKCCALRM